MLSLPHAYWINLEKDDRRRSNMEAMFSVHGVTHTRVVAVDGNDPSNVERHLGLSPPPWGCREYATTVSHLYAILCFLQDKSNTSEYGFICEDDLSFEYVSSWSRPFAEYVTSSPSDWEVLQLCVISQDSHMGDLNVDYAVPRLQPVWYSSCAYLIRRASALKLMLMHGVSLTSNRPCISLPPPPLHYPHAMFADHLIYRECRTYSLPLFTYTAIDSSINPECVSGHMYHKNAITQLHSASTSRSQNIGLLSGKPSIQNGGTLLSNI